MKRFAFVLVLVLAISTATAKAELKMMGSNFDVTFYGYIKAEMAYHSARGFGDNWLVFAYPDMEPYKSQNTLTFTARQTRFGFNISAPGPSEDSKVLGNLEFDFYGSGWTENKPALMMRRATITLKYPKWSILVGNEWMLMSPLYPHVSNYPAGAGIGNLGYRMPQFRFTFGDQFRVAVSAGEKIEGDLTTSDFDAGDNSATPDFQAQIGYWGKNGLILVFSGHYGEEKYDEGPDSAGSYHDVTFESWSVNFSMNVPITKKFGIGGEFFHGVNLDAWYTGSIFGQGVGKTASGRRVPVHDTGGWGEFWVKPIDKLTAYIGYGVDDPLDRELKGGPWPKLPSSLLPVDGGFTRNQMYYTHILYNITKAFVVSLEVMRVDTEYKNDGIPGNDGQVYRTDLAFWFFF